MKKLAVSCSADAAQLWASAWKTSQERCGLSTIYPACFALTVAALTATTKKAEHAG
jgi:hypothetical protein